MKDDGGDIVGLVVNAARIGEVGGLRTFTDAFVRCFDQHHGVTAMIPTGVRLRAEVRQVNLPKWVASSSRVSLLRPVLWWIYSAFCFPRAGQMRVLSTTHHVLPFRRHQIVTVHDLRPYYYQDSWIQWLYWHVILPRALRKCDGVLTVSKTSKSLLVSVYKLRAESIHVVPNVVDSEFFHPATGGTEVSEPFLLTVGSAWKHKNVVELLEIHRYWSAKYRLKIVAGQGQYSDLLRHRAAELGISDRVQFFMGLPAGELLALYQQCAALVFPSIMEGFGLLPLEAMACGRPVIVSDSQLFHELYGDVPIYVELGNIESWEKAFTTLETYPDKRSDAGIVLAGSYSQRRMCGALREALLKIWGIDFQTGFERA